MPTVRKGQAPDTLSREVFRVRFENSFFDPAFESERDAIARLEAIAWDAYVQGRKAPRTAKAGPGFADPDYDLSVEWREARDRLHAAEIQQKAASTKARVLVIGMGLIDAGMQSRLDRYIGYYEPYATSHDALDRDQGIQEEVRNVARGVANAIGGCAPAASPPPMRN